MKTKVVNLYQYYYDVYIGRAGKGKDGTFGNPVVIGKSCPICAKVHLTNADVLPCYEVYLKKRLEDPEFKKAFMGLKGKVLGCFCKPKPCHGDVMASYLENMQ